MGEGRIIIPARANVWPHELDTARALAAAGRTVGFLPTVGGKGVKTADMQMGGVAWEMKSPESGKLSALDRNLRRALRQSPNVVIDARRMRGLGSAAIERELTLLARELGSLRRLVLVTREGEVVDIKP